MSFAREFFGLKYEVRQSTASNVYYFYPKIGGANVTATVPSATYNLYTPEGTAVTGGACSQTLDGTNLTLYVTLPALSVLGEDYQLRFTWSDAFGQSHLDVVLFDVVLYPWQESTVSLNSMQEERADIGDVLERLGARLSQTPEAYAGIIAGRARVELDAMLRDQIAKDGASASMSRVDLPGGPLHIRPRLILNRERLDRVERKLALQLAYAADMNGPEGDDESAGLYRHYKTEAESAFRSMGPLKYDRGETLQPSSELTEIGRTVSMRRVQG